MEDNRQRWEMDRIIVRAELEVEGGTMADSAEIMQQIFKETKDLIKSMEGTATSRVRIDVPNFTIEVQREGAAFTGAVMPMAMPAAASAGGGAPASAPGTIAVVAPIVGVFYRSGSPGAKPFVEVGDTVERGQVVGIVEAMKVMNEVTSDYRGVVSEILVGNGEAVW
jgi:acetyl-CoA carboxylase biotin carboxyl carrier protein